MLPEAARVDHVDGVQALFIKASVLLAIGVIVQLIFARFTVHSKFWRAQPWTGLRAEWFAKSRASFRTIGGIRQMLDEGYESVGASNVPNVSQIVLC